MAFLLLLACYAAASAGSDGGTSKLLDLGQRGHPHQPHHRHHPSDSRRPSEHRLRPFSIHMPNAPAFRTHVDRANDTHVARTSLRGRESSITPPVPLPEHGFHGKLVAHENGKTH